MKISRPLPGSGTVRQYQPIPGTLADIPRHAKWLGMTRDGGPRDTVMTRIDECLQLYEGAGDGWKRLALLGELYFCTNWFLKRPPGAPPKPREEAVNYLFVTVVDRLCKSFNCTPNVLPQMLEECWGRILTPHGHEVDTQQAPVGALPKVAIYLKRAEVERYRIRFRNGMAFMRERFKVESWVLAHSADMGWEYAPHIKEEMMQPGYAGFALSMGRELFMAHHRGGFHKDNFFHSSYLSGDTVLCTGTILIQHGVVRGLCNDSGHYQPTVEHLINVLQTFRMLGVDVSRIWVTAKPKSWKVNGVAQNKWGAWWGSDLLLKRGGEALQQRITANQMQVANRGGVMTNPVVNLPPPNRPPPPPPRGA